jgi:hypothetical protein
VGSEGDHWMKLTEIAERIGIHLRRLEQDTEFNAPHPVYKTRRLFCAHAHRGGSYVMVRYVSYQGTISLTKENALKYLAWLDAGNKGRHWEALSDD